MNVVHLLFNFLARSSDEAAASLGIPARSETVGAGLELVLRVGDQVIQVLTAAERTQRES